MVGCNENGLGFLAYFFFGLFDYVLRVVLRQWRRSAWLGSVGRWYKPRPQNSKRNQDFILPGSWTRVALPSN